MNSIGTEILPQPKALFLVDEQEIKELKKEVNNGNLTRIKALVKLFSLNIEHDFLEKDPHLANKFSKLIIKKFLEGRISNTTKVLACIATFQKYNLYSPGSIVEKVNFLCQDGEVSINKELLCFRSKVINTQLNSSFKEKEKNEGVHNIDYRESYHKKTLELLKTLLYTGKIPELDNTIESIQVVAEFISFIHYADIVLKQIDSIILDQKFYLALTECKVNSEKDLELILSSLEDVILVDRYYIPYAFMFIGQYLECKLDTKYLPESNIFAISFDQISLLNSGSLVELDPGLGAEKEKVDELSSDGKEIGPTNSPIIANFLNKYINGVVLTSENQLDQFVLFSLFSKNNVLEKMTHSFLSLALLDGKHSKLVIKSIASALPNLEGLYILDVYDFAEHFDESWKIIKARLHLKELWIEPRHPDVNAQFDDIIKESEAVHNSEGEKESSKKMPRVRFTEK